MELNPSMFLAMQVTAGGVLQLILLLALFAFIGWGVSDRRVRHIAGLTWKAAFRLRFVWVMILLLILIVGGLPAVLRDDGSPQGMAQIILTYTLSMTTAILGFATLWLSVGSMARDIGGCQMQMIATKPVARWQIWLGKWLGVMSLNLALLGVAGGIVYGMVEYRARALTTAQYERLRDRSEDEIRNLTVQELGQHALYQFDEEKQDFVLDENKQPILRPVDELKQELARLPEEVLRHQVLVARAPLDLLEVRMQLPSSNAPPYTVALGDWLKLEREKAEAAALAEALASVQQAAAARQAELRRRKRNVTVEIPQALPEAEKARIREEVRLQYLAYTQIMEPMQGHQFRFRKPRIGYDAERGLVLRFQFEDTRMNFKGDRQYQLGIMYGSSKNEGMVRVPSRGFTAMTLHEQGLVAMVPMKGADNQVVRHDVFGPNGVMHLSLFNLERRVPGAEYLGALKVPFLDEATGELNPRGVEVMYYEGGFLKNYLRALAVVFAWLGVLAAMGLAAASFMSFPMAVFACMGILLISFCTSLMKDVADDGTIMQTYTEGVRDKSIVDTFAVYSFKALVAVISPVKDYSPIGDLTDGRAITWGQLFRAYAFIWGITGLLISVAGAFIFTQRQLAITDSEE